MILPRPRSPFEWRDVAGLPALVCPPLEPFARHVFTTRQWQLGQRAPATLHGPGAPGRDDPGWQEGWGEIASALDVEEARIVKVRQVHGADVALVRDGAPTRTDADVIVGVDPSCALAIRVADCVPLLIADRRSGAVAAAHAGWRGLAAGVPGVAVRALLEAAGSRSGDLIAAAGPSIGACCYEVKTDVYAMFETTGFSRAELERWFSGTPRPSPDNPPMRAFEAGPGSSDGRWFFDGWACLRDQLVAAGIDPAQVFLADTCTASHAGAFCSYRRDGPPAGRLVGAIRSGSRRR